MASTISHDFKYHVTVVSERRNPHHTTNILRKVVREQLQKMEKDIMPRKERRKKKC